MSLFNKDFSMTTLSGDFLKAYGSDPNVVGYYYDEQTGQMHAKMKNGSIATYGFNFKNFSPAPAVSSTNSETTEFFGGSNTSQQSTPGPVSRPVSPTPSAPTPPPPPPSPVKMAPIDTILYPSDNEMPVEIMADLIFENIGGQELINISRNDTINGQPISYQPIKNISLIQQSYNPNNILSLQQTSDKIFAGFAIKQESKVPNVGNGPNGSNVYRDENTGDIIIEFVNIEVNEQADIQFAIDGTIYEVNL